ncbi:hypothetical protein KAU11_04735, partial [Candidatus Babeliales bacterium]|nr:hypothetical protein [Candidatus Babeliales bacterium]
GKRVAQLKKTKEKKMRDWESQSEFSFQGTLEEGTTEATEKATHKIIGMNGDVLGYLYSEDIDLRAYEERIVTVIGMKYVSTQSPTGKQIPVLKLKKISLE